MSSAQLHFGEERVLSGTRGSGTIFLSHCNLHCVFCQNCDISHQGRGSIVSVEGCAEMMLALQQAGAHNVNLVSPTHYSPQLADAIKLARKQGLEVPLVWNSNAYEKVETLKALDGLVDIYLPDFKYADDASGLKYSGAKNYPSIALQALQEMFRQVGGLKLSASGLALRGVLVRHLVLPNGISGSPTVLRMLWEKFGLNLSLNLMAQYHPAAEARKYPELSRRLFRKEYLEALEVAQSFPFIHLFSQNPDFLPDKAVETREKGDRF